MNDLRHPSGRRRFLAGSAALLGAALLAGCDRLGAKPWFRKLLDKDEDANLYVQRLLLSDQKLAPEYTAADVSPWFKPNGTADPPDKAYKALVKNGFKTFRLEIGGLVELPLKLSLAELRGMTSRTQITRHDCVEGWSCIGQWTGVPLSALLQRAKLKPQARFVVFYCADTMEESGSLDQSTDADDADEEESDEKNPSKPIKSVPKATVSKAGNNAKGNMTPDEQSPAAKAGSETRKRETGQTGTLLDPGGRYYESIDLEDAVHPQTILAYEMNGKPLPVAHGAPLRLRLERQLGYKMAKYVMRIVVVDRLEPIGKGGGGYWEDNGYEWYAGI